MRDNINLGTWLSLGSPIIAEIASYSTVDWLLFDLEHGFGSVENLLPCLISADNNSKKLIVRVGSLDSSLISHALDWGADGIMLPHVELDSQAKTCVSAMNYPPLGHKGYSSSSRKYRYGLEGKSSNPNSPLFLAQIETVKGVMNAPKIAAVEGVDVLFIGPSDLSLDLEYHANGEVKDFGKAVDLVLAAANKENKKAGILVRSIDEVKKYSSMGFEYIAYGSDLSFIKQGFKDLDNMSG